MQGAASFEDVMHRLRFPLAASLPLAALAVALLIGDTRPGLADPTVGHVQEWEDGTTQGWGGGSQVDNPGTGGVLGETDGFLRVSNTFSSKFGSFSIGSEYLGDWVAAGITKIEVWLNDVGNDEALEIHYSTGMSMVNFWQYNVGFIPPEHQWGRFIVDLSSSANWTQTQGTGTFTAALQNVDRAHFRHDLAPYGPNPDPIFADLGIDHLVLRDDTPASVPEPAAVASPVELAPPYPNPSRGPVSFALRASDGGPVRLEIVDVTGRRVRHAVLAAGASGPRTWVWDGLDDSGAPVPPGTYRARALGASGGTSRSLIRVR